MHPSPRSTASILRTPSGTARVHLGAPLEDPAPWVAAALERMDSRRSGEPAAIAGVDVVVKAGPVRRGTALRWLARRALGAGASPAEREFQLLGWLRARMFRAVEPVAAVTLVGHGRVRGQLFASARLAGAEPVDLAWQDADAPSRARWATELGAELGRMHALRFLHADLYPRNVLVDREAPDGRALVWLDAWAGGPTAWRVGRFAPLERDLGSFFCEATRWMDGPHQRRVLDAYWRARAVNGRPVDGSGRWLARARRAREEEIDRFSARPARLRGAPLPERAWPALEGWVAPD